MPLAEFEAFLRDDLGLRSGDTLFVHASFTELRVDCTPEDVVHLLMRIVGENGNLLMPFYPIKGSYEWLCGGHVFDLRKHRTNMGALAIAFAKLEGARKSTHPTKAVVVWGKDRDFLVSGHNTSPMPYSAASPYSKVTQLPNSKVCGLGVSAARLSCMHVAVDALDDYPVQPYHPQPMHGSVIDLDGTQIDVITYAHDLNVCNNEDVPRFLRTTKCPTYRDVRYKRRVFFVVGAKEVVEHTAAMAKKGKTFFYPPSLRFAQPRRIPVTAPEPDSLAGRTLPH